jgi:DNA-binding CsgD family transcriptional regulator
MVSAILVPAASRFRRASLQACRVDYTAHQVTVRSVIVFGLAAGLLIAAMRFVEYRFLVVEHSVELYGALVASAFAAAGIWLGRKLTRPKTVRVEVPVEVPVEVRVEVPVPAPVGPFVVNAAKAEALGLTPRELEVLQLIAEGLSTREMADRLCVSESTVKTHVNRVLDKLGASRRTQAVQLGREMGLLA